MDVGEELGRGVRSIVYAYGPDDVVKIANASTPTSWLPEELRLMDAAALAGARVPGRRRLVEVDGRIALASERIHGPSMWDLLVADPQRAADLGRQLAELQTGLAGAPSYELPTQRDRLLSKIHLAAAAYGPDLLAAIDLLPAGREPLVLCHGDLHPRNVLLAADGPVFVDWFDASRGAVIGEIARTALMIEHSGELGVAPVPAAALATLREHYLGAACDLAGIAPDELEGWDVVQRIARLAEGFDADRVGTLRDRLASVARRVPAGG